MARRHTNTNGRAGVKGKVNIGDGVYDMIEDFDKLDAQAHGPRVEKGTYVQRGLYDGKGDKDNRITKAGAYAKATTGKAEANASVFKAYAEGPCAGAGAEARHVPYTPLAGVHAGAEASLGKAGIKAGPAVVELNPNVNTNIGISTTGVHANLAGFGVSIGKSTKINTPLGSVGFEF